VWQIRASQVKEIRHLECFATQSLLSSALLAALAATLQQKPPAVRVTQKRGSTFCEDFFGSNQGPKWLLHHSQNKTLEALTQASLLPARNRPKRGSVAPRIPDDIMTRHHQSKNLPPPSIDPLVLPPLTITTAQRYSFRPPPPLPLVCELAKHASAGKAGVAAPRRSTGLK
jgi:hypothetical protein